jgi:nucleotide-binding universal stress UspA family protein
MFSSIVVGTDGSSRARQAVASAAELARTHGAKLHLVRAFRPTLQAAAVAAGDAMMALAPTTDMEIQAQVEEDLERLAAEIERDGVAVQVYACPQSAPSAIISVAAHQDADLIVIGSKGMHGARRVLGSVPNSIAHQATCAVMIVPTG